MVFSNRCFNVRSCYTLPQTKQYGIRILPGDFGKNVHQKNMVFRWNQVCDITKYVFSIDRKLLPHKLDLAGIIGKFVQIDGIVD